MPKTTALNIKAPNLLNQYFQVCRYTIYVVKKNVLLSGKIAVIQQLNAVNVGKEMKLT